MSRGPKPIIIELSTEEKTGVKRPGCWSPISRQMRLIPCGMAYTCGFRWEQTKITDLAHVAHLWLITHWSVVRAGKSSRDSGAA